MQTQAQALQGDLAGKRQLRAAKTGLQALQRFVQILMDHPGKTGDFPVPGPGLFVSIA
ncbi:hypothetical protein D9M71_798350 [compost metagenome]